MHLYRRSLSYYWRTHLATVLAVASAGAVLTGAMVVGDSMRAGLREMAVRRLGPVDHVLQGRRWFGEGFAERIAADPRFRRAGLDRASPAILLAGSIQQADSGRRANRISVLAIDARFAAMWPSARLLIPAERQIVLNEPLARSLEARVGDDVLLRVPRQDAISAETLLGRRDASYTTLRLSVAAVIPLDGPGRFSLDGSRPEPLNAFVPTATLQRVLKQPGRVNTILVTAEPRHAGNAYEQLGRLTFRLNDHADLADFGMLLSDRSLKSDSLLVPPAMEAAGLEAAKDAGLAAVPVLTWLANSIAVERPRLAPRPATSSLPAGTTDEVPYSVVAAVDTRGWPAGSAFELESGEPLGPALAKDEILLNTWTAEELKARVGDRVRLTYYVSAAFGQLRTESAAFRVRGVVRMAGLAGDRELVPAYPGMTDARRISDWDPPVPIDLKRIRPQDESYWDQYGPTPKAFISLSAGQALWARAAPHQGRITSIELRPRTPTNGNPDWPRFRAMLRSAFHAATAGLSFQAVKADALAAAEGSTDFSGLFLAFSFFLVAASVMLIALVFRLGVEKRAPQIGLLLATGFTPRAVAQSFLAEGATLALVGSAVGLLAAGGYAAALLRLMAWWWPVQAGWPQVNVHIEPATLAAGFAGSVLIAVGSIAWGIRGASRRSPRALLAGAMEGESQIATRGVAAVDFAKPRATLTTSTTIALLCVGVALLTMIGAGIGWMSQTGAFFASGALLLVASLLTVSRMLRMCGHYNVTRISAQAILWLAIRNAARNPRRSVLTVALVACATFIIVAVGANRKSATASTDRHGGTGGYALVADSTTPVLADLNTPAGQDALRLQPGTRATLRDATIIPFRFRAGDDASCANLSRPRTPRILGATETAIRRGGFAFASSLAHTPEQRRNPWLLLNDTLADGAVPAIGDESTVLWLLHSGLGKELAIADDLGRRMELRFVGLLAGSILQSEIVIGEAAFVEHFPGVAGYGFFLIDAPGRAAGELRRALSDDLGDCGMNVEFAVDRLGRYLAVENTYIAAFQLLGGLGMVLGTFGLTAVLLRNVLERRRELALLQAVGYRQRTIAGILLAESALLMLLGLGAGGLSALVTAVPHLRGGVAAAPWGMVAVLLALVVVVGVAAGAAALRITVRGPLWPALRND